MSTQTTNLKLVKPLENEFYDINIMNANMDKIDEAMAAKETPAGAQAKVDAHKTEANPHPQYALNTEVATVQNALATHTADYVRQPGFGTTAGSANIYTLTLSPVLTAYTAGVCVSVKIHAANTGASTININGLGAKVILDSKRNPLTSGKLMLYGIYTLRYDSGSNSFILQGEGGSGNATASDLLSGKTASVDAGDITGTMPNNGSQTSTIIINSSATPTKLIPSGYTPGGIVTAQVDASLASSIKTGVTIGGVVGTFTNDANAVAGEIAGGKTAYVNGVKLTGTIPIRTNTDTNGSYPAGINCSMYDGTIYMMPPVGYFNNVWVAWSDTNFTAANIKAGVVIGSGGSGGKVTGTFTADANAVADDLASGKTAYVNGVKVTGTAPSYPIVTAGTANNLAFKQTPSDVYASTETYVDLVTLTDFRFKGTIRVDVNVYTNTSGGCMFRLMADGVQIQQYTSNDYSASVSYTINMPVSSLKLQVRPKNITGYSYLHTGSLTLKIAENPLTLIAPK